MNLRLLFMAAGMAAATVAVADQYKVVVSLPAEKAEDFEGAMAYIKNYDTSEDMDSTLIADGVATFSGQIGNPVLARVVVDGSPVSQFILETGDIKVDVATREVSGTPLNALNREINDSVRAIYAEYQACTTPEAAAAVEAKYGEFLDNTMVANISNPIGLSLALQKAYELEPAELSAMLDKYPVLKESTRMNRIIAMNERKAATGEGSKYVDFEIDGKKLSDYVGKDGKYLLVDFWASWCGPCIRQTVVIKEIYNKYKDANLNVLGVAVWDEPDNTLAAIKQHELPWECIINAGSVPTDIYGISGIPCIMLIAPDGTIISRDKQGDELKAAVDAALAK